MLKTVAAEATAVFVTASALAFSQTPSVPLPERLNAADWNKIDLINAALGR
jgi:hypothetical protein